VGQAGVVKAGGAEATERTSTNLREELLSDGTWRAKRRGVA
jgi:hypothetical protein